MLDPAALADRLEQLAQCALAVVAELRAVPAENVMSGEPIELMEVQMAERLGWTPGKLQKKRERRECEGLYRKAGRSILYSVPLTLQAFSVVSPDTSM